METQNTSGDPEIFHHVNKRNFYEAKKCRSKNKKKLNLFLINLFRQNLY